MKKTVCKILIGAFIAATLTGCGMDSLNSTDVTTEEGQDDIEETTTEKETEEKSGKRPFEL